MAKPPQRFELTWMDAGRVAKSPPDPRFPNGVTADLTLGARLACQVNLPYPAPRVGKWLVQCKECGLTAMITAAGRPDDPRTARLACKHPLNQSCSPPLPPF